MLGGIGRAASSSARMAGRGATRFAGYQGGMKFSTMGKARMGATVAGLGMAGFHNNANRGGYKSGYIPKSSATQGLNPRSSGGMTMM